MTSIPTLSQLYSDVLTDLQTELGVTVNPALRLVLRAIAGVQAARLKLLYLAVAFVQKNIFPDTADSEASGGTLERFGRAKIGRNPFPATQGEYQLKVNGTPGAVIPAGTTYRSDAGSLSPGQLYVVDAAYTLPIAIGSVPVRALTAGTAGKLNLGDTLTATAPIIGVTGAAMATTETVQPVDAETTEQYRKVVLQSYRLYPQGGAAADYRLWGQSVNGVAAIYPYAASGAPNEVNVFVEATVAASTNGMGTPGSTMLAAVAANLETDPVTGKGRRPLGVFRVNTLAVVVNKIDIVIYGASATSAANRAIINAALAAAIGAVRPFIAGADALAQRNDVFGINNIAATVLAAVPGTLFSTSEMFITIGAGSPILTPSKIFDQGNIPFLNSVTYA